MRRGFIVFTLCLMAAARALGQSNEVDLGYTELQQEQGSNLYTGSGVRVMQIEAILDTGDNDWLPNPTDSQFAHVTFYDQSGAGTYSTHATAVGEYFYGSTSSFTPGITKVDAYQADLWIGSNFLNTDSQFLPTLTSDRVANSSWIGEIPAESGGEDIASDLDALRRLDYVVQQDGMVNVVACNNGNPQYSLMADSLNSITVGLTSGGAARETTNLNDAVYTAGRAAPLVVVPANQNETSYGTPLVASTAALLIDLAHNNTSLSNGTFLSNGVTLQYGESVDVIKAAIMAGADRDAAGFVTYGASPTQNGLDTRYGAGQLDVYNSYHVILGGQQTPGTIGSYGWDYNPSSSNSGVEDYVFSGELTVRATLAWEAHISQSSSNGSELTFSAALADFQLSLYQMTGGKTLIASSVSTIDNTQNIYFTGLNSADTYELEVTRASTDTQGNWDYGLAWDMTPTPEPGAAAVLLVEMVGLLRRRNPKPEI